MVLTAEKKSRTCLGSFANCCSPCHRVHSRLFNLVANNSIAAIETLALFIVLARFVLHDILTLGVCTVHACIKPGEKVETIISHSELSFCGYFFHCTNLRRNLWVMWSGSVAFFKRLVDSTEFTFVSSYRVYSSTVRQGHTFHSLRTCSLVSWSCQSLEDPYHQYSVS